MAPPDFVKQRSNSIEIKSTLALGWRSCTPNQQLQLGDTWQGASYLYKNRASYLCFSNSFFSSSNMLIEIKPLFGTGISCKRSPLASPISLSFPQLHMSLKASRAVGETLRISCRVHIAWKQRGCPSMMQIIWEVHRSWCFG